MFSIETTSRSKSQRNSIDFEVILRNGDRMNEKTKRIVKSSQENQRFFIDPLFHWWKLFWDRFFDPSCPKRPTERNNLQEQDPGKMVLSKIVRSNFGKFTKKNREKQCFCLVF